MKTQLNNIKIKDTLRELRKRAFCFLGRASRSEFRVTCLVILLSIALLVATYYFLWITTALAGFINETLWGLQEQYLGYILFDTRSLAITLVALAAIDTVLIGAALILLEYLSISCKRLHDIGLTGYWMLLTFTPLGILLFFVLVLLPSKPDNEYGVQPPELL